MTAPAAEALIKYRMEQAVGVLEDARRLTMAGGTPQSIVNRSYYAMFYATLALLQTVRKFPRKHGGMLAFFDSEFVRKGIFPPEMSRNLHRAFDLRQESDYRDLFPLNREKAEDLLEKADHFVAAVRAYLLDSTASSAP